MISEDTFTRTVEDAEAFERRRAGPYPLDEDDFDGDSPDEDDEEEPCCNCFSCPCGGSGAVGR